MRLLKSNLGVVTKCSEKLDETEVTPVTNLNISHKLQNEIKRAAGITVMSHQAEVRMPLYNNHVFKEFTC